MDRVLKRVRISDRAFVWITFAVYAAITLWCTLHHEAWGDEADTWLVMRDGGLADIFGRTAYPYRGTPLLWYFVLWPFARFGAPFLAQQLLNLAFAWGAVLLVLRSRAFPRVVKVLFAFSYYAAFEYAVVARNYALLMFLVFLMAEWWRTREEKPMRLAIAITLLANVAAHGLLIAAVAGLVLLLERRVKKLAPFAVMIAGGILCAIQLWPQPGGQTVRFLVGIDTVWYAFSSAFFPDMRIETATIPALLVFALIVYGSSRSAFPPMFLLIATTLLMFIFVIIWIGGLRHAGILLLLAVATLWIADAYGPYRRERLVMAALAVSLAYSIVPAVKAWRVETTSPYSGSREMADYLTRTGLVQKELAGDFTIYSILVYLPGKSMWYGGTENYGSFAEWDLKWQAMKGIPQAEIIERAQRHFAGREWLLLLKKEIPAEKKDEFRLIHKSREPWARYDERYWLYEPVRSAP